MTAWYVIPKAILITESLACTLGGLIGDGMIIMVELGSLPACFFIAGQKEDIEISSLILSNILNWNGLPPYL
jgi:hypothetical protein